MKTKTIIIISLLFLLIGASIWEEIFIRKSLNDIISKTQTITTNLQNNTSLTDKDLIDDLNDIERYWIKTESTLRFVNNHNDMKEIGDAICYAKTYISQNKKEELTEKLNLIIFYAKCYKEILTFNIQNVI